MIKLILRTDRASHGLTFWREDNTPADVHHLDRADTRRLIRWWTRRDRNKPVTDKPRPVIGFQAPKEEP